MEVHTSPKLPGRKADGHKGTFGRAALVCGSEGMSGAAILAGKAALRAGAGLVTLAIPRSILPIVASAEPSYMTRALSDDADGRINGTTALEAVRAVLELNDVAAIGSGLGQSDSLLKMITQVYQESAKPLLCDADALNLLARERHAIGQHAGPRLLTPHPGEFARLIDVAIGEVESNRQHLAEKFAAQFDVVLLLKGSVTIVTDGRQTYHNTTGNSGLATGGSGDVLTGLITGLLAQGMEPFEAARLGAHLHGLAAEIGVRQKSEYGLIASDLPEYLCDAFSQMG